MTKLRILVLGIGNPGRQDDGLGAACVERLEALCLPAVTCETRYQLHLEDAKSCSAHDIVVFTDAAENLDESFSLSALEKSTHVPMSTHSFRPEAILAICETLYRKNPKAFLLAIRGHHWDIGEELSPQGTENLKAAVEALTGFLKTHIQERNPVSDEMKPKEKSCLKKKSSS